MDLERLKDLPRGPKKALEERPQAVRVALALGGHVDRQKVLARHREGK